ncbi:MAG: heme biosynthesis HemY N-terminal domain-containing protein [Candidatus Rickettsia vulgarisii]
MIRLLIICAIFLLLYFGFSLLSQLDSILTIKLYNYQIESSFFTSIVIYILSTIIIIGAIKIICAIIDIPSSIKGIFRTKKANSNTSQLIETMKELIIGERTKSLSAIKKINKNGLKQDKKKLYHLLLAETEENTDQKIKYFQELEQAKYCLSFVTKRLAQIFYNSDTYKKSEDYAVKSFYLNEYDSENLETLLNCYSKLGEWEKFTFIVPKLHKADKQKFESIKDKIVDNYILAAKNMIDANDNKKALYYLELALGISPANYKALDHYLTINFSNKKNKDPKILQEAFAKKPSFEIVELYKKFYSLKPVEIYKNLESIVNPQEHLGLFLSIAAYLDLPDKIKSLKDESLSYETEIPS